MNQVNIIIPSDLQKILDLYDSDRLKHVNSFVDELDTHTPPDYVYHYTNEIGLLGILESRKIRLTDIFGLNDTSELRHGVNIACEMLDSAAAGHRVSELFSSSIKEVVNKSIEQTANYFVACFSKDGDDLGQWRAYGDNGRGFALKFDGIFFKKEFESANKLGFFMRTFPIHYDDTLLRVLHQKLIDATLPITKMYFHEDLSNAVINEFMKHLSIRFCLSAILSSIFFKHKAYKNEQEYRFLQMRGTTETVDDLKHQARDYSLVRFAEFDWKSNDQNVIQEIVIGPAANEENAQSFIKDCLHKHGFDHTKMIICKSEIPYRSK